MQQPILSNDPKLFSEEKENQYFDRKSARKDEKEIAKHISAFANASGGKLVIGIEDDGEITGFRRDGARDIEEFEQAPLVTCTPGPVVHPIRMPVINSKGETDQILVLDIEPSPDHVVSRTSDKEVFLRQKDKSVKLDCEQILALEYDKNQRSYENEVQDRSSIDDVDAEVLSRYKADIGASELSDERVLRSRGFLVGGHLTNAGVLLFSEYPGKFMPQARVRVLRVDGTKLATGSRMNIVKDRTFDGPLPKQIEGAKQLISSLLREFQYLGEDGRFEVIPEYPEFAWFEGLVNAVTHRNYAFSGDYIRVIMYDDRMEITSPGRLPNIVTLENMRYTRFSRNPVIARVLVEMGWVRELNEGVQRIYDEMASFFLNEPVYSEPNNSSVLLTLENSATSRVLRQHDSLETSVGVDVLEGLNEYEIAAMQLAMTRGRVTTKTLGEVIGKGPTLCGRTLKELASDGRDLLDWHGSSTHDPSQYYSLSKEIFGEKRGPKTE